MAEKVFIKLDGGIMPTLGSTYAGAYDLYVPDDYEVRVGRQLIDLKFSVELPLWWKANIRPRSGFSLKGIEFRCYRPDGELVAVTDAFPRLDADVLLGLVDCDYRGHVGVILNVHSLPTSTNKYVIPKGTRIAQMEFVRGEAVNLCEVSDIDTSIDRGGGFGHTGV